MILLVTKIDIGEPKAAISMRPGEPISDAAFPSKEPSLAIARGGGRTSHDDLIPLSVENLEVYERGELVEEAESMRDLNSRSGCASDEDEGQKKKRTRGLLNDEDGTRVKMVRYAAAANADWRGKIAEGGEGREGVAHKESCSQVEEKPLILQCIELNGDEEREEIHPQSHNHYGEQRLSSSLELNGHSPASKRFRTSTGLQPFEKSTPGYRHILTTNVAGSDGPSETPSETTAAIFSSAAKNPPLWKVSAEKGRDVFTPSCHVQEMYKNLEHLGKEWEEACGLSTSARWQDLPSRSHRKLLVSSNRALAPAGGPRTEVVGSTAGVDNTEVQELLLPASNRGLYRREKNREEDGKESEEEQQRSTWKRKNARITDGNESSTTSSLHCMRDGEGNDNITPPLPSHRSSVEEGQEEENKKRNLIVPVDPPRTLEEFVPTPHRHHKDGKRLQMGGKGIEIPVRKSEGEEEEEKRGESEVVGEDTSAEKWVPPFSLQKRGSKDAFIAPPEVKAVHPSCVAEQAVLHRSFLQRASSGPSRSIPSGSDPAPSVSRRSGVGKRGGVPRHGTVHPSPTAFESPPVASPPGTLSAVMTNSPFHNLHHRSGSRQPSSLRRPQASPIGAAPAASSAGGGGSRVAPRTQYSTLLGNGLQTPTLPNPPGFSHAEGGDTALAGSARSATPLKASSLSTFPTQPSLSGPSAAPPLHVSPSALSKRTRDGRIKVVVRKRPLMSTELGNDCVSVSSPQIILEVTKQRVDLSSYQQKSEFSFDAVLSENDPNEVVYKNCTQELLDLALGGGSASCFAYGQTGSGKTHTMIGSEQEQGLYLIAVTDLFQRMPSSYRLAASFYEIYCNSLFDLLNGHAAVVLREGGDRRVNVCGLTWHAVESPESLWEMVSAGMEQRSTGSTSANEHSSRSHAVLSIRITSTESQNFVGVLNFVDLAGSERAADTATTDKQTRLEGAEINKSLLALKECIRALDERRKHVPFRGSRLTEVLRDSFTGNSKTVMIANVSPSSVNFEHTANTLRYAFRVKGLSIPTVSPDRARNAPRPCVPVAASFHRFRSHEAHSCPARGGADVGTLCPPELPRFSTSSVKTPVYFSALPSPSQGSSVTGNQKQYAYGNAVARSNRQLLPPPSYPAGSADGARSAGAGTAAPEADDAAKDGHRTWWSSAQSSLSNEKEVAALEGESTPYRSHGLRPTSQGMALHHYFSASTLRRAGAESADGEDSLGASSSFSRAPEDSISRIPLGIGDAAERSMGTNVSYGPTSSLDHLSHSPPLESSHAELVGEKKERRQLPRRRPIGEEKTNPLIQLLFAKRHKHSRRERRSSEDYTADQEDGANSRGEKESMVDVYPRVKHTSHSERLDRSPSLGKEGNDREIDELKQRLLRRVIRKVQRDLGREIQFILDERDQMIADLQQENTSLRHTIDRMKTHDLSVAPSSASGMRRGTSENASTVRSFASSHHLPHSVTPPIPPVREPALLFSSPPIPRSPPLVRCTTSDHYTPLSSDQPPGSRDVNISSSSDYIHENLSGKYGRDIGCAHEEKQLWAPIEEEI